jgi:hypothetical protein
VATLVKSPSSEFAHHNVATHATQLHSFDSDFGFADTADRACRSSHLFRLDFAQHERLSRFPLGLVCTG